MYKKGVAFERTTEPVVWGNVDTISASNGYKSLSILCRCNFESQCNA